MKEHDVSIRLIKYEDKPQFILAMQQSESLHHPWIKAPLTDKEFDEYFQRVQKDNCSGYLVCDALGDIAGVFNVSEIVRGLFQNAFLGFYAVESYAGQGYMSAGIKLLLGIVFNELQLHRIEANIQPANTHSINLVKNNGFRHEGYSPNYLKVNEVWQGHEHWAMTYEDFNVL